MHRVLWWALVWPLCAGFRSHHRIVPRLAPLFDGRESGADSAKGVDVVDVISNFIDVRKTSTGGLARCPFHDDKSPSFSISKEKQLWKCFGCGQSGDAVTFVKEFNGVSYKQAVEQLADLGGLPLSRRGRNADGNSEIFRVLEAAAAYYAHVLTSEPCAGGARAHLRQRSIPPAIALRFRLGFSPPLYTRGTPTVVQHLIDSGFSMELLAKAGLVSAKAAAKEWTRDWLPPDRFAGRLVVPILDSSSRVVGFGGRVLPVAEQAEQEDAASDASSAPPKYLNSPETPVFRKGYNVYGLPEARTGLMGDTLGVDLGAILVEGYFDVLSLHAVGVRGAVAALGTAVTSAQVLAAARASPSKRITVCLDADAAGQRATDRLCAEILPDLIAEGVDAYVGRLDGAKDPSDWLQGGHVGSEFVDMIRSNAVPFSDFYIERLIKRFRADASPKDPTTNEADTLATAAQVANDQLAFHRLVSDLSDFLARLPTAADRTFAAYRTAAAVAPDNEGMRIALEADILQLSAAKVRSREKREEAITGARSAAATTTTTTTTTTPTTTTPTTTTTSAVKTKAAQGPQRITNAPPSTVDGAVRAPKTKASRDGSAKSIVARLVQQNEHWQLGILQDAVHETQPRYTKGKGASRREARFSSAGGPRLSASVRRRAAAVGIAPEVLAAAEDSKKTPQESYTTQPAGSASSNPMSAELDPVVYAQNAEIELLKTLINFPEQRQACLATLRPHLERPIQEESTTPYRNPVAFLDPARRWFMDAMLSLPPDFSDKPAAFLLDRLQAAVPHLFGAGADSTEAPPPEGEARVQNSSCWEALPAAPADLQEADLSYLFTVDEDLQSVGVLKSPQLVIQQALAAHLRARAILDKRSLEARFVDEAREMSLIISEWQTGQNRSARSLLPVDEAAKMEEVALEKLAEAPFPTTEEVDVDENARSAPSKAYEAVVRRQELERIRRTQLEQISGLRKNESRFVGAVQEVLEEMLYETKALAEGGKVPGAIQARARSRTEAGGMDRVKSLVQEGLGGQLDERMWPDEIRDQLANLEASFARLRDQAAVIQDLELRWLLIKRRADEIAEEQDWERRMRKSGQEQLIPVISDAVKQAHEKVHQAAEEDDEGALSSAVMEVQRLAQSKRASKTSEKALPPPPDAMPRQTKAGPRAPAASPITGKREPSKKPRAAWGSGAVQMAEAVPTPRFEDDDDDDNLEPPEMVDAAPAEIIDEERRVESRSRLEAPRTEKRGVWGISDVEAEEVRPSSGGERTMEEVGDMTEAVEASVPTTIPMGKPDFGGVQRASSVCDRSDSPGQSAQDRLRQQFEAAKRRLSTSAQKQVQQQSEGLEPDSDR